MRKKIILLGSCLLLVALYVSVKLSLDARAEKAAAAVITKIAPYSAVQYKDISCNLFTLQTTLSDVTITPRGSSESTHIAAIVIKDIDKQNEIPGYLSIAFKGVEADLPQGADSIEDFKKLGYGDKIFYNADIDYIYDAPKKEFFIKKLSVDAKDIGRIALELHVGNIELGQTQLLGLLFTYPSVLFYDAKLTYTDNSFVKRSLDLAAKDAHQDIDTYKKELLAKIRQDAGDANDPFVKEAMASVEKFINAPGTISLTLSPKHPQPLETILRVQDPKELLHLINMHVSAS